MSDNDPPSLAERYACATNAKSLQVKPRSAGAADILMAVAMSGDSLGSSLMRLRAEFDCRAMEVKGTGNNALTDRLLILMQLKSLEGVRDKVGDLAAKQAAVSRFPGTHFDAMSLAGRVLDIWLDPNCDKCDGRGFTGGGRHEQTSAQVLCRPCGGTGKRRHDIGRNTSERQFAARLMALLERSADRAANGAMMNLR